MDEKTLELNVSSEILDLLRSLINQKAYLKGLTLRQEGICGWDNAASLNSKRFFFFQYKAPKKKRSRFIINNNRAKNQHNILYMLSQGIPGRVFYVFPCYYTEPQLIASLPKLLNRTYFLDVARVGFLSSSIHTATINEKNLIVYIRSKKKKVKLIKFKEFLKKSKGFVPNEVKKLQSLFERFEGKFSPMRISSLIIGKSQGELKDSLKKNLEEF